MKPPPKVMNELNAAARQSATQTTAASRESDELRRPVPGGYDRRALAVGRAVQQATGAAPVILFGSRARGDYREDSDIDLLVIHSDREDAAVSAMEKDNAQAVAKTQYGTFVEAQIVWFSSAEFDGRRRSVNDVTAVAVAEGIAMDGQRAAGQFPNNGDYSYEPVITGQRCRYAREYLKMMHLGVMHKELAGFIVGEYGYRVLEQAMKALISASGHRYPHHYDLLELERQMRLAAPSFPNPLESFLSNLNNYSNAGKYWQPCSLLMSKEEVYRQALNDVRQIFARVAHLTGQDPWAEPADAAVG